MSNSRLGTNRNGFGMVQIIVGAAILAIISVGFMQMLSSSSRSSRKIASFVSSEIARQSVSAYIDCETTFQAGANDSKCYDPAKVTPAVCSLTTSASTFSGPSFRLARRTANGTIMWLTEPLAADGTTRFGDLVLKVGCSATDQSLIVKAEPYAPGMSLDWANAKTLFGSGDGLVPLCFGAPAKPRPNSPYYPWHQPSTCKWDVNNDHMITPSDGLPIVTLRNTNGGDVSLTDLCPLTPPVYYDVNKNGVVDSNDATTVIDYLNNTGAGPCP